MPPSTADAGPVVISSDDDDDEEARRGFQPLSSSSSATVIASQRPAVPTLPHGYVLAPIRGLGESERGRPERISTLREVLSTRNSRQRQIARRGGSGRQQQQQQQTGHSVPPPISRAPIIARTHHHTGEEPVEPGVYNPIRSRALLPHERQRRREGNNAPTAAAAAAQNGSPLPTATAGRLLNDGTISVDDVDDSAYTEAIPAGLHQIVGRWFAGDNGRRGAGRGRARGDTDEDDEDDDEDEDDDDEEMYYSTSEESSAATTSTSVPRQWWRDSVPGSSSAARRGRAELERHAPGLALFGGGGGGGGGNRQMHFAAARDANFFLPFHTGILSHHHMQHRRRTQRRQDRNGSINHLDFFPGEDLGDLLSFLEANAPPPPPSRPMSPARPVKLTKLQEELSANPDYSRRVPDVNYRDSAETPTGKSLEIVCTQCTGSLFDKEHIWATSCGHVICNACVEAFAGASKSCGACKKRVMKKSLVHLYT